MVGGLWLSGAIRDTLGPTVKLAARVAIKVKDVVRFQDKHSRSQGYSAMEPEKKKATQDDLNKLDSKMHKGPLYRGASSDCLDQDIAARMSLASAAAEMGGEQGGGAFGPTGKFAQEVPNVEELDSQDSDNGGDDPVDKEESGQPGQPGTGSTPRKCQKEEDDATSVTHSSSARKKPECWAKRDDQIATAVKAHEKWVSDKLKDLGGKQTKAQQKHNKTKQKQNKTKTKTKQNKTK